MQPKNVAREVFINVNCGALDKLASNDWVETYAEPDTTESDDDVELGDTAV